MHSTVLILVLRLWVRRTIGRGKRTAGRGKRARGRGKRTIGRGKCASARGTSMGGHAMSARRCGQEAKRQNHLEGVPSRY